MITKRIPASEKTLFTTGKKILANHPGIIVAVAYWKTISVSRINNKTEKGGCYVRK
jgi:hypothetical protein